MHVWCCHNKLYIGIAVRLVGGNSYHEGRVELYYNGEWGTVCDDGWDDADAGVVCRQLGFGSSGTAIIGQKFFSEGPGPLWLDGVSCVGRELTLASCGHLGVGIFRHCVRFESNAGVRCPTDRVKGNLLLVCNFATKFYVCTYNNGLATNLLIHWVIIRVAKDNIIIVNHSCIFREQG